MPAADDPRIEADLAAAKAANDGLAELKGQFVAARAEPGELGGLHRPGDRRSTSRRPTRMWSVGAYRLARRPRRRATIRPGPSSRPTCAPARRRSPPRACSSPWRSTSWRTPSSRRRWRPTAGRARWRPWLRRVRAGAAARAVRRPGADADRPRRRPSPTGAGCSTRPWPGCRPRSAGETLTLSEALNRLSDPDAARRKAARPRRLAKALERAHAACWRSASTPWPSRSRSRTAGGNIPTRPPPATSPTRSTPTRWTALEAAVVDGYAAVSHRYYRAEGQGDGPHRPGLLGPQRPARHGPPRTYGWDEAKSHGAGQLRRAGARVRRHRPDLLRPALDRRPARGPASSRAPIPTPVTADRHPYVFMNYMGERRDVLTLAHELGHAVHQTLCKPLGTLLADTPLTLAETASIFGEGLVFEKLLAEASQGRAARACWPARSRTGSTRWCARSPSTASRPASTPRACRASCRPTRSAALWLEVMGESLGPAVQAEQGLRALLGLYQPLRPRALLRLRLRLRRPAGARPDGEAARGPGRPSRRSTRTLLAAGGTKTYVEALAPVRARPAREGVLGGRHEAAGAAGGRVRGLGLIGPATYAFAAAPGSSGAYVR